MRSHVASPAGRLDQLEGSVHLGGAHRSHPEPGLGERGGLLRRAAKFGGLGPCRADPVERCTGAVHPLPRQVHVGSGSTQRGHAVADVHVHARCAWRATTRSFMCSAGDALRRRPSLRVFRPHQERLRLLTAGGARQESSCLNRAHAITVVCQMPHHLTL